MKDPSIVNDLDKIQSVVDRVNALIFSFIDEHGEDYTLSAFVQISDSEFNGLRVRVSQLFADFGAPDGKSPA